MSDLHTRLIAAKLAGTQTSDGYMFRTNEMAADLAVTLVKAWLREQATEAERSAAQTDDPGATKWLIMADILDAVADRTRGGTDG